MLSFSLILEGRICRGIPALQAYLASSLSSAYVYDSSLPRARERNGSFPSKLSARFILGRGFVDGAPGYLGPVPGAVECNRLRVSRLLGWGNGKSLTWVHPPCLMQGLNASYSRLSIKKEAVGNSTQCCVWWLKWEGNPRNRGLWISLADSLCCTVKTSTTLWSSYTLIKREKATGYR